MRRAILQTAWSSLAANFPSIPPRERCRRALLGSVIKTTCFLADMNDFAAFNEVYARYFINCPARSCVAVKALPKNALCEIEAVAELTP